MASTAAKGHLPIAACSGIDSCEAAMLMRTEQQPEQPDLPMPFMMSSTVQSPHMASTASLRQGQLQALHASTHTCRGIAGFITLYSGMYCIAVCLPRTRRICMSHRYYTEFTSEAQYYHRPFQAQAAASMAWGPGILFPPHCNPIRYYRSAPMCGCAAARAHRRPGQMQPYPRGSNFMCLPHCGGCDP